jgi:hypothetical protein
MKSGAAQRIVLGAWVAMIGLATVRAVTDPLHKGLPLPSVFLGSAVLFTLFYGAAAFLPPLAATLAVGVDVGALVRPYISGGPAPLDTLATWLDKLNGAPASAAAPAPAPGGGTGAAPGGPVASA